MVRVFLLLNTPCLTLNCKRYGSRVSGAIQVKEYRLSLYLSVIATGEGAFRSPLTIVGQLIYIYIYIYVLSYSVIQHLSTFSFIKMFLNDFFVHTHTYIYIYIYIYI